MKTETVNISQLAQILRGVSHAMPIAFAALVNVKARKTGNPFGDIAKFSRVQAFTGFDYESSVNRQLSREGKDQLTFEAKERSWGERISPALVENNGKLYLVAKIERTAKPIFLTRRNGFLSVTPKEMVAPFLPPSRPATNQGTEKEIVYRNYSLESLISLSIAGRKLRIRH